MVGNFGNFFALQQHEQHEQATGWMTEKINGAVRVGFRGRASTRSCASPPIPALFNDRLIPSTAEVAGVQLGSSASCDGIRGFLCWERGRGVSKRLGRRRRQRE